MIIKKIFNNNCMLAKDSNKREVVVMGCGVGFKKKVGEKVDNQLVEKVFILKEKEAYGKFKLLLEDIPEKQISLCYDIIEYAKNILGVELNEYIYVTLTDHISHAIKLYVEGIDKPNMLIWEIKKFYAKEFKVGLKALEFIENETSYKLNEDEAGSIALHLINAQVNNKYSDVEDVFNITKKIKDILTIIKYTYEIDLNENSLSYERFITHLRFFFKRLERKEEKQNEEDDFLLNKVKIKYIKAYECMLKIEKYLEVELNKEEQLYLTLHIQRVTQS